MWVWKTRKKSDNASNREITIKPMKYFYMTLNATESNIDSPKKIYWINRNLGDG